MRDLRGAIGLGCMRLTDEAVVHAALDAGVRLLDTADVYGPEDGVTGANERLVARALASWDGDRGSVRIATKGGLTRPGGRWRPDGRAKHLRAACEASLAALGVERIGLYLLHAPDPRTPLATSVRALGRLLDEGLVGAVGLCNVNRSQLDEALAHVPVAAVQVAASPFDAVALWGGVVERCAELGIALIAHSPLGGPKKAGRVARERALVEVAERRGTTPAAVALAWLRDLGMTPIPGATRVETAEALGVEVVLDEGDRQTLDARYRAAARLRTPASARRPPADADGEVVLVVGSQGAGKSEAAEAWVARGYARLNRDEAGGTMARLLTRLERGLADGVRRWVLDNTFPDRASRAPFVDAAWRHGVPVRCEYRPIAPGDAQVNVARRILRRHGELPGGAELKALGKRDIHAFPPRVLHAFERDHEPPAEDEGFRTLDVVPFARRPPEGDGAAVLVRLDAVDAAARARLAGRVLGYAWRPGVGGMDEEDEGEDGVEDAVICTHPAGPPVCWCRPPLPGLGVVLVERHGLDPARCTVVGRGPSDRAFAERLGMAYRDAGEV